MGGTPSIAEPFQAVWHIQAHACLSCSEEKEALNGAAPPVLLKNGERLSRVPGTAIVYTNTYTGIPAAFTNLLKNYPGLHENVIFITIR